MPRHDPDDFFAYRPKHNYIFAPTGDFWTAASINAELGDVQGVKASVWLDQNKPVDQITWAPGERRMIHDRLVNQGGFFDHRNARCFNTYREPKLNGGDPAEAAPWIHHVRKIYPDDADHIIRWCAQRVQFPEIKINHALLLGGEMGVGKDTLLEPLKHAVGGWNFQEASPTQVMGAFNGFLKGVVLRIPEVRDLGEVNRYQFYDHMKAYTAAPPDVLRVNEKHINEYYILNCCGVVYTTNYKTDGIYLPSGDRRTYVAWSPVALSDIPKSYWNVIWGWYNDGGLDHVHAYLMNLDISPFDAKAPPPKTQAFWEIVDASRAPEDAELDDLLDDLSRPAAVTLDRLTTRAQGAILDWLQDRKNRRALPYRMERCGYTPVRNNDAKDGLWKIGGKRQVVYARSDLPMRDQFAAAAAL